MAFYEDDAIDLRFRNRLEDFRNSGYDRGHLVGTLLHNALHAFHTRRQDSLNAA